MTFECVPSGRDHTAMGAVPEEGGVHFAVFSEHAEQIDLCLFDESGQEAQRLILPERLGMIWQGLVPDLPHGMRYGFRAHGPNDPKQGHRFHPSKLLIDPYAQALDGGLRFHASMFGGERDTAPFIPKAIVPHQKLSFDWQDDAPPRRAFSETIIYEAHVKGLTQTHPHIPDELRGTYEALAHPAILDHLTKLGVTAIELLPVHGFVDEPFLSKKGLTNYWGYNSLTFFAPAQKYYGPNGADGLKAAIKALHTAGIEVILDVVYNHTAEGGADGPVLSFKGLDNTSYYRLDPENPAAYINDTGCGNTLNINHPMVLRMVVDSLRYWVDEFHVDGFRFDLAPALCRTDTGFDPASPFLTAVLQDPVLREVKLIAEPWDIGPGGYQLGAFPAGFAEWNDRFRDDVRKSWRQDPDSLSGLATRLMGSADLFDHSGRQTWASVNMITAHDGFTLNDVVSYSKKHNEANGEKNRDGHGENLSSNGGVEGPTDDPAILAHRRQRQRNMLATLLLAQGVPMLLAGDEFSNSQSGNNNAYCQDNETGWLNWRDADPDLLAFTRRLIALRHVHPALRQAWFLHSEERGSDGQPDIEWLAFDGEALAWDDPSFSKVALHLRMAADGPEQLHDLDEVVIAINTGDAPGQLSLPDNRGKWVCAVDTADTLRDHAPVSGPQAIAGQSVQIFVTREHGDAS